MRELIIRFKQGLNERVIKKTLTWADHENIEGASAEDLAHIIIAGGYQTDDGLPNCLISAHFADQTPLNVRNKKGFEDDGYRWFYFDQDDVIEAVNRETAKEMFVKDYYSDCGEWTIENGSVSVYRLPSYYIFTEEDKWETVIENGEVTDRTQEIDVQIRPDAPEGLSEAEEEEWYDDNWDHYRGHDRVCDFSWREVDEVVKDLTEDEWKAGESK